MPNARRYNHDIQNSFKYDTCYQENYLLTSFHHDAGEPVSL